MLDVAPTPDSDATRPDPALLELKRPPSPLHASSPKRRAPSPSLKARTPSKDAGGGALRPVDREHTTAPQQAGPANCRLLWRGKVVTQDGQSLHGIAIIAHLFSVASTSSGVVPRFSPALAAAAAAASSSLSPFDDPFSSASSAGASGADMCLGLEMLRGAPITAKGDVRIVTDTAAQLPRSGSGGGGGGGSRDRKGKGKASETQESPAEAIQVETPTDVRVYIDDRCPETVDWLQDKFCREGRQGYGVRFNAGGEEVVIFAKLPEEAADPTPSTSEAAASATLPGLTLLLGRPVRSRANQPRPDDPMPRENLFAKKLRKTASLPASAFPTATARGPLEPAPPPATKRRRQSAKEKAIASLLGGSGLVDDKSKRKKASEVAMPPPASRSKPSALSSSLPGANLFGAASSATTNRSFGRTSSTSRFSSVEPAHSGKGLFSRQTSLPPNVGLPLRRSSSVSAAATLPTHSSRSSLQRSHSRSSMLLESPPGSEDEADEEEEEGDGDLVDRAFMRQFRAGSASARSRIGSRAPPSRTPSVMSLAEPDDQAMDVDGGDDDAESLDAVAELRAFAPNSNTLDTAEKWGAPSDSIANVGADRAGGRKQMARSSSLPVGQFALASVGTTKGRRTRAGSTSSSVDGVHPAVADVGESGMPSKTNALSSTVSAVETRNKNTVKKITMNLMDNFGCGKAHSEFKDIFSLTTRGVAFAMRSTFKTAPLSTEDRQRATTLIEKHLVMYMPVELFPLVKTLAVGGGGDDDDRDDPLEPGKPVAKQVEAVGREPPSPESLGDHHPLEESESRAIVEPGGGLLVGDAPETQVELEEETQVEETQLEETQLEETQLDETQMAGQGGMDVEAASAINIDQVATKPSNDPYISKPLDNARHDEEDAEVEEDEIILVEVPARTSSLETGILS